MCVTGWLCMLIDLYSVVDALSCIFGRMITCYMEGYVGACVCGAIRREQPLSAMARIDAILHTHTWLFT